PPCPPPLPYATLFRSDGRSWTRLAIPDPGPGELTDVASSGDALVIVGAAGGAPYAQMAGGSSLDSLAWRPLVAEAGAPSSGVTIDRQSRRLNSSHVKM